MTGWSLMLYQERESPDPFAGHHRGAHIPLTEKLPGCRRSTLNRGVTGVRGERAVCSFTTPGNGRMDGSVEIGQHE